MMREIKFRGWHTEHKKMFSAEEMLEDQLTITTFGEFINVSSSNVRFSTIYPKNKFIPMQYTCLKDKNGVEIYEGDMLAIPSEYHEQILDDGSGPDYEYCQQKEVEFHEGSFGCFMDADNYFDERFYPLSDIIDSSVSGDNEIEVIGNTYVVDEEFD